MQSIPTFVPWILNEQLLSNSPTTPSMLFGDVCTVFLPPIQRKPLHPTTISGASVRPISRSGFPEIQNTTLVPRPLLRRPRLRKNKRTHRRTPPQSLLILLNRTKVIINERMLDVVLAALPHFWCSYYYYYYYHYLRSMCMPAGDSNIMNRTLALYSGLYLSSHLPGICDCGTALEAITRHIYWSPTHGHQFAGHDRHTYKG